MAFFYTHHRQTEQEQIDCYDKRTSAESVDKQEFRKFCSCDSACCFYAVAGCHDFADAAVVDCALVGTSVHYERYGRGYHQHGSQARDYACGKMRALISKESHERAVSSAPVLFGA